MTMLRLLPPGPFTESFQCEASRGLVHLAVCSVQTHLLLFFLGEEKGVWSVKGQPGAAVIP